MLSVFPLRCCPTCSGNKFAKYSVAAAGTIFSYTTVHLQGREPAGRERSVSLPYTIVVVALDDVNLRIPGVVNGAAPGNGICVGARVEGVDSAFTVTGESAFTVVRG
jgi:uncharacterized OB-fold protein